MTPARCPKRRRVPRSALGATRRARAWTTTAEAASPAASSAPEPIRAPPVSRHFAYGSNVNTKTMKGTRAYALGGTRGPPRVRARVQRPRPAVHRARVRVRAASSRENRRRAFEIRALRDGDARRGVRRHGRAVADHPAHGNPYVREDVTLSACPHPRGSTATRHPPRRRRSSRRRWARRRDAGGALPSAYPGLLREGADEWGLDPSWRDYLRVAVQAHDPDFRHQDAGRGGGGGFVRAAAASPRPRRRRWRRGAFETLLEPSGGTSGGAGSVGTPDGDDDPELVERVAEAAFAAGLRVRGDDVGGTTRLGAGVRVGRQQRRSPSEARLIRSSQVKYKYASRLKIQRVAAVRDGFGCADTTR